MTDEEGEGVEGEGEAGTADRRVRTGPRNKPTAREREEHEATYRPFRDSCTHCTMGRGRTHHHVSKKKSEDLSRRPTIVMDYDFLKPNSEVNSHTIPEKSVTYIAVEERHQNIMSSLVLKKGIEEPWASEGVARLINSLRYKEVTLKSGTELEKLCTRELQRRGHVGGCSQRRQAFKRMGRKRCDVFARCHQNHQVLCGELHIRSTPRRLPNLAVVGGTCREHFVQVP